MNSNNSSVVFFDIVNTLGSPKLTPESLLIALNAYIYVPNVLRQLQEEDIRLGVISNIGNDTAENVERVLEKLGILAFFDPDLLIYEPKYSPEIFRNAATQAGLSTTSEHCLFVGEDSIEHHYAIEDGWRAVSYPLLVMDMLKGRHLRYITLGMSAEQANSDWQNPLRDLPIVPIHVTSNNKGTKI